MDLICPSADRSLNTTRRGTARWGTARNSAPKREHGGPRRLGADSDADLVAAARSVLADPMTEWEECGVWETDGPAMLMGSVTAGNEPDAEYPDGGGLPEQVPVPIPPGRWTVRAVHTSANEETSVGLVRLLPWSPS
ncbi:Imm21 family immunity protein [Streptomyces sp. NPDC051771]|uniref:Imm21 family immunity protein n=1 Tax=Streptomyces sp. NPDC051771 TaxID=3154847 RepID=UPI003412F7D2